MQENLNDIEEKVIPYLEDREGRIFDFSDIKLSRKEMMKISNKFSTNKEVQDITTQLELSEEIITIILQNSFGLEDKTIADILDYNYEAYGFADYVTLITGLTNEVFTKAGEVPAKKNPFLEKIKAELEAEKAKAEF